MAKTNYETVKAWRKLNPDKVNAQAARRRKKVPEKFAAVRLRYREKGGAVLLEKEATQARARRRNDPEGQRLRKLKFKAKREAERVEVAGRPRPEICDICEGNHHLGIVFDHCHNTGKFRGWLCDRCNKTLGIVKDSPDLLRKMAEYLDGQVDHLAKERSA